MMICHWFYNDSGAIGRAGVEEKLKNSAADVDLLAQQKKLQEQIKEFRVDLRQAGWFTGLPENEETKIVLLAKGMWDRRAQIFPLPENVRIAYSAPLPFCAHHRPLFLRTTQQKNKTKSGFELANPPFLLTRSATKAKAIRPTTNTRNPRQTKYR